MFNTVKSPGVNVFFFFLRKHTSLVLPCNMWAHRLTPICATCRAAVSETLLKPHHINITTDRRDRKKRQITHV